MPNRVRPAARPVTDFQAAAVCLDHMGPEDPSNRKKIPIFFVDAKFSQIARGFQKWKS